MDLIIVLGAILLTTKAGRIEILWGNPLPQRWGPNSELAVEGAEPNRGDQTPEHLTNHVPQACGPDCDHLLPPQGSDDGLPPR